MFFFQMFCKKLLPDTDVLVLVDQMGSALEVEAHHLSGVAAKEILGATLRSQVFIITGILGDLE